MRRTIIQVVEQIAVSLGFEFKPFVPDFIPYLLRVLTRDDSEKQLVTLKVISDFSIRTAASQNTADTDELLLGKTQ